MTVSKKHQLKSAEEFVKLRTSSNPEEYLQAAHGEATLEIWHEIIDRYSDMRIWVAHNKSVPLVILKRLALDPDPEVRRSVAIKRKLDAAVFELLSKDVDESVRGAVYSNPRTPQAIQGSMAAPENHFTSRLGGKR